MESEILDANEEKEGLSHLGPQPVLKVQGSPYEPSFHLRIQLRQFIVTTLSRKRRKLYSPPSARQFWEEEQEEFETDWAELFFDLIYVGMAFKLGHQLSEDFDKGDTGKAILFFLGQFIPMYGVWYQRAVFLARFICDSLFHKCLDITESIIVAFMALFIGTSAEIIAGAKQSSEASHENSTETSHFVNSFLLFLNQVLKFHLIFYLLFVWLSFAFQLFIALNISKFVIKHIIAQLMNKYWCLKKKA